MRMESHHAHSMAALRVVVLYRKVSSQRFIRKVCIRALQYFPIFTSLLALVECLSLSFDMEIVPVDGIWRLDMPKVLLLVMKYGCVAVFMLVSKAFGFCTMNRLMILYTSSVIFCVDWRKYVGFGEYLDAYRFIMACIGIVLFVKLVVNWRDYRNNANRI